MTIQLFFFVFEEFDECESVGDDVFKDQRFPRRWLTVVVVMRGPNLEEWGFGVTMSDTNGGQWMSDTNGGQWITILLMLIIGPYRRSPVRISWIYNALSTSVQRSLPSSV